MPMGADFIGCSIPLHARFTRYHVTMSTILVVCVGNTARGDDGVAHTVASQLALEQLPSTTRIISSMGLDIAMAADVAQASFVIMVDAVRRTEPAVTIASVTAAPPSTATGHGIDPSGLLSLAESLYGHLPQAVLVEVAAPEMEHKDGLSRIAQAAAVEAACAVADLVRAR